MNPAAPVADASPAHFAPAADEVARNGAPKPRSRHTVNATAQAVGASLAHLAPQRLMKPPEAAYPRPEAVHRRDDAAPAPPRTPAEHGLSSAPLPPAPRALAIDGAQEKHPRRSAPTVATIDRISPLIREMYTS